MSPVWLAAGLARGRMTAPKTMPTVWALPTSAQPLVMIERLERAIGAQTTSSSGACLATG